MQGADSAFAEQPDTAPSQLFCVLVTYRRPDELSHYLDLLATVAPDIAGVVVVDNDPGPTGAGIAAAASSSSLRVDYLASPDNLGPAGGVRLGLSHLARCMAPATGSSCSTTTTRRVTPGCSPPCTSSRRPSGPSTPGSAWSGSAVPGSTDDTPVSCAWRTRSSTGPSTSISSLAACCRSCPPPRFETPVRRMTRCSSAWRRSISASGSSDTATASSPMDRCCWPTGVEGGDSARPCRPFRARNWSGGGTTPSGTRSGSPAATATRRRRRAATAENVLGRPIADLRRQRSGWRSLTWLNVRGAFDVWTGRMGQRVDPADPRYGEAGANGAVRREGDSLP